MKKYNTKKNKSNKLLFIIAFMLLIITGYFADLQACQIITNMKEINNSNIYLVTFENGKQDIIVSKKIDFIIYGDSYFVKIKNCDIAYSLIEKQ